MQCEGASLGNRKLWWARWWDEQRQPPWGHTLLSPAPKSSCCVPFTATPAKGPLMCPKGACFKGSWPHSESAMWEL